MISGARPASTRGKLLRKLLTALLASLFVLFISIAACRRFRAEEEAATPPAVEIQIAGRMVVVWKPVGATPPEGYPVIIFSHGFTGCGKQSIFLTGGLAEAGYFVLAPNHHDALCGGSDPNEGLFDKLSTMHSQQSFRKPELWTDSTYRDRRDDVEALLNGILKDNSFQGIPIDPSRIGLAGHSLGGYTVLALAGAWPAWKDGRIKAVLALSPYCAPFIGRGNLEHLNVPVMYQGGTLDFGITPTVRQPGGAYDSTSPPKYYVEFRGAGHLAWTNLNPLHHSLINEYSIAFFDRYLKGKTSPDPLAPLVQPPWPSMIKDLRFAER